MWTLEKLSSPGWEKHFPTEDAAKRALVNCVCPDCLRTDASNPPELLGTRCGLEYEIYETAKGPAKRFIKIDQ